MLEVDAGEAGELAELHGEDVLGLQLAELEGLAGERDPGRGAVVAGADGGDDLVDDVDGLEATLADVEVLGGLGEAVLGATADDLDLVVDVGLERLDQVERAGDAVDERHGVDREVRLQLGVLVEVVEHHQAGGVLLQPDDQAGLALGGLVVDVGDALDGARSRPAP